MGRRSRHHLRHGPLYVQPERSLHPRADRDLPLESRGQPASGEDGEPLHRCPLWRLLLSGSPVGRGERHHDGYERNDVQPGRNCDPRAGRDVPLESERPARRMEQRLHGCER